jgi:hypothetical protein
VFIESINVLKITHHLGILYLQSPIIIYDHLEVISNVIPIMQSSLKRRH